ncbi:hypothetical protein F4801DRAFT_596074 [Xylaria longipes]|nr:hypothetical protein F4801DRAFT_596074 [Xylaria longipes]
MTQSHFYVKRLTSAFRPIDEYVPTGDMADLEEAIEMASLSLQETSQDDITTGGAIKDLDKRIAIFKKVVSERPLDSPETVSRLDNPGNGYANRYLRTDAQADLYQAIAILQEAAIDATPTGHHTTERLANASLRLRGKFLRNRDMADLKEAVRLSQKYIKVAPPEHPIQAACFDTAGIISRLRY